MTKSVSFGVCCCLSAWECHLARCAFSSAVFSPLANKIIQRTRLASRLSFGVVLALLCFVLFNDCVQPCFKPKTIQPNIIIDLDLLFASDRRHLHKVIRGLHRLPKIFNPKPPQSLNLIDKADLIPNKCGLTSLHKPCSLFLHLSTCLHQQTTRHVFESKSRIRRNSHNGVLFRQCSLQTCTRPC